MDTKFWGPSGWRLLHLISFTYDVKNKKAVKEFFELLPFILPCKFCRASLSDYMDEDPVDVSSRPALSKWLWRIHNKVNEKLRGQGLLKEKDPSFEAVKKMYEDRISAGIEFFEGWDFLFSIAENHPYSRDSKKSLPMEGCPSKESLLCEKDKNRWNTMTPDERFNKYTEFWKIVGNVLPFDEWKDAWKGCKINVKTFEERKTLVKEIWRIQCCIEKNLELVKHEKFQSLCKRLASHRSGCGKKLRARTCRRSTRSTRSTPAKVPTRRLKRISHRIPK
jgi:hypothetical protein